MKRYTCLWLIAASLITAAVASASEVTKFDRFRLWNECRPLEFKVNSLSDDATSIGLTKNAIEVTIRSRLRAARLYGDDYAETAAATLFISVLVLGPAFNTILEYTKVVRDRVTGFDNWAPTWRIGATGTHGRNSGYILGSVAEDTDRFIDEYLRVNDDACK